MATKRRAPTERPIRWRAPEFLYQKKTILWYVLVGGVFYLVVLALFAIGNWAGALITGLAFWVFLTKSNDAPKTVAYEISDTGITIGERFIDYGELRDFAVDTAHAVPVVVFELTYTWALPVTMVLKRDIADDALDRLSNHVAFRPRVPLVRLITHWLHY